MAITAPSPTSLVFNVRRCEPELVVPAKLTPHEYKQLSDVDDGERHHVPAIMFCRYDQSLEGKDPVKVIREAIARTLVFYYPYAGRLREGPDAKFMVECTGEGVMFIEADADVTLEEFGDAPHPPFPCIDELIFEVPVFEVPGSGGLVNCPLLVFRSLIDLLVIKGPPFLTMVHSYFVSDITRTRFEALDFGLGKAAFGGPGKIFPEPGLDPANNYMPMKNSQGDEEIMVPMCLPTLAIERFVKELDSILGDH
ncbi:benzyl alcohol O-benzoyltransferase-like [Quercus suber]|uniref:Benzyl alcohol o-benzoyltransferase n=1 Tax=Quercus suber TaxID=58331 RepID=A0AAW0M5G5_QUESU|nr:benzyl alcohol o-benzoyltransferase [Quercus suber]